MPLKEYDELLTELNLYYISVTTENPNILTADSFRSIGTTDFKIVRIGEFVKPGSIETIYVVGMFIAENKDNVIRDFISIIMNIDRDAVIYINQNTFYNMPTPMSKLLKNPELKYWEH